MADHDTYVLVAEARTFCRGVTEALEAAHLTRCCALVQRLADELETLRAEFDVFRKRTLEEIAAIERAERGKSAPDLQQLIMENLQKAAEAYTQLLAAANVLN